MPPPPRAKKKLKGPARASEGLVSSRAKGALLGLCVGEALGAPLERRNLPANHFPDLNDEPRDMRRNLRLDLPAGQVLWGSEMAFCLATSLRNYNGFDINETARAYRQWLPDGIDVPEKVTAALELLGEGRTAEYIGRRVWLDNSQNIKDNAALARTAPIGVYFAWDREERVRASLEDTSITHFMPLCRLASATYNAIIAAALTCANEHITTNELLPIIETELSFAAALLARLEPDWVAHVADAADWLREDVRSARDADPQLYGPDLHLFTWPTTVRVSFRLALWELFHAPSFEAGVLDVVNRGGDADTNAAITGALLGAVWGDRAIPPLWVETLMEAPGPMGGRHWDLYHPRALVTLEPKRTD